MTIVLSIVGIIYCLAFGAMLLAWGYMQYQIINMPGPLTIVSAVLSNDATDGSDR
jgi:hypothetical protein